jgi:hypothetical protein
MSYYLFYSGYATWAGAQPWSRLPFFTSREWAHYTASFFHQTVTLTGCWVRHPFGLEGRGSSGVGRVRIYAKAFAGQYSADSGQTKDKSRTAPLDVKGLQHPAVNIEFNSS